MAQSSSQSMTFLQGDDVNPLWWMVGKDPHAPQKTPHDVEVDTDMFKGVKFEPKKQLFSKNFNAERQLIAKIPQEYYPYKNNETNRETTPDVLSFHVSEDEETEFKPMFGWLNDCKEADQMLKMQMPTKVKESLKRQFQKKLQHEALYTANCQRILLEANSSDFMNSWKKDDGTKLCSMARLVRIVAYVYAFYAPYDCVTENVWYDFPMGAFLMLDGTENGRKELYNTVKLQQTFTVIGRIAMG